MKRSAADEQHSEDNFRKGFSDKLKQYQAAPDRDLWNRIEFSLDKQEAGVYKKRYKLFSQLAAACLLLLLSAGGFLAFRYWNQPAGNAPVAVNNSAEDKAIAAAAEKQTAAPETPAPPTAALPTEPAVATTETGQEQQSAMATPEVIPDDLPEVAEVAPQGITMEQPKAIARTKAADPTKAAAAVAVVPAHKPSASELPEPRPKPGFSAGNPTVSSAKTSQQPAIAMQDQIARTSTNAGLNASETTGLSSDTPSAAKKAGFPGPGKSAAVAGAPAVPANGTSAQPKPAVVAGKPATIDSAGTLPALAAMASKATIPDSAITVEALPKGKVLSKWSVGASYAVQHFNQNLSLTTEAIPARSLGNIFPATQTDNGSVVAEFNEATSSAFSWQAGAEVGYSLGARWKLLSGLRFISNQAVSKTSYLVRQNPPSTGAQIESFADAQPVLQAVLNHSPQNPYARPVPVEETNTYYRYQYLGLPLQVQYNYISRKKWQGFVAVGGILSRLTNNLNLFESRVEQDALLAQGPVAKPEEKLRNWHVAGIVATGLAYQVAPHWQLQAGAELNWYTRSLFSNEAITALEQGKPLTIGARAGFSYTFSK